MQRLNKKNQYRDKQRNALVKRLRQPGYTAADEAAYDQQQAAQADQIDEPDAATRDAAVKRIIAAEKAELRRQKRIEWRDKRIANLKRMVGDRDHADQTATTTWFGGKTTTEDMGRIRPYLQVISTLEQQQRKDRGETGPQPPHHAARETRTTWFGFGSKTTVTHLPGDASRPYRERQALEHAHNQRTLTRLVKLDPVQHRIAGSTAQDVQTRLRRTLTAAKEKTAAMRSKWQDRVRKPPAKDRDKDQDLER